MNSITDNGSSYTIKFNGEITTVEKTPGWQLIVELIRRRENGNADPISAEELARQVGLDITDDGA